MTAYIFDSETTGLNQPQLVEAAWLQLASIAEPVATGTFLQRYKPAKAIELGALATSHILDEELEGCPAHDTFDLPGDISSTSTSTTSSASAPSADCLFNPSFIQKQAQRRLFCCPRKGKSI